jgi:hypothetical protein
VQDYGTNPGFMALKINLRGARPIRGPDNIDLFVAQRRAHVVQIIHRNRRCVEFEIGFWF